jgi:8-oxo-dGTP diphosphatase
MNFHGTKVAILVGDKLLMLLRDNKPGLFNANMWDFPGGGRKGKENHQECAIREIREELGIKINSKSFIWEKIYPAQKDPNQKAFFIVAKISGENIKGIKLNEGQKWALFDKETFFKKDNVVEALKLRFNDYLKSI